MHLYTLRRRLNYIFRYQVERLINKQADMDSTSILSLFLQLKTFVNLLSDSGRHNMYYI